jgi:hypothetical protein
MTMVAEVRRALTACTASTLTAPGAAQAGNPVPAADPVMPNVMSPEPAVRPVKRAPAAAKVRKIRTQNPELPQEEVAKKAGVSVRTVARHWQDTAPRANDDPQTVNGQLPGQLALA